MEKVQNIIYQFKICVSLDEYEQAIEYFENIVNFIDEYDYKEVEIINRLVKKTLRHRRKLLDDIIAMNLALPQNEINNTQVVEFFTGYAYKETIEMVHRLQTCIVIAYNKIKNDKELALMNKILGKLHAFLYTYEDYDKTINLETALMYYHKALELAMANLNKFEVLRYKIYLSYLKFAKSCMKDHYKTMLFCINVRKEMKEIVKKIDLSDNKLISDISIIQNKFDAFFDANIEAYNKVVNIYFPELRTYQ